MRERGRVSWFDRKLGYGFITTEAGTDVFVHHTKIGEVEGNGKFLDAGDDVEFEAREVVRREGGKRIQAFDVSIIKSKEENSQRRVIVG